MIAMRELIERTNWTTLAAVRLLTAFGTMALLLAAVGLYGVMSYAVSQSTRELGLRMALGAEGPDLLRRVMRYGAGLAVAGIAAGAGAAAGTTRLLGDLYQVSPRDPLVFAGAFAVMAIAALAACLIPALRVMRTDPVRALRGGIAFFVRPGRTAPFGRGSEPGVMIRNEFAMHLVRGWPFGVLHDEEVAGGRYRLEFQSKLLLEGREDRRSGGIRGRGGSCRVLAIAASHDGQASERTGRIPIGSEYEIDEESSGKTGLV